MSRFVLRTDGGARGNPGPAGIAFVLTDPDRRTVIAQGGSYLGEAHQQRRRVRGAALGAAHGG